MKPGQVSQELIDDLVRIGTLKNGYPFRERSMFNELGLYVQMKSWKGMTSLKAGGKFISRINLYQPEQDQMWELKKFKPGEWQELVKPTLELAEWLHKWEGMGGPIAELDFREAVQGFKKTGSLKLPRTEEVEYFKALADLRRVSNECLNMVGETMKLLIRQVQSEQIVMRSGLDIGSTNITRECEVLEECLRKAENVQVPEHLRLHNKAFLAFLRTAIDSGWLARDCHKVFEDQGFSDSVTKESALRHKIEEYLESAKEYWELHKEEVTIVEQLKREEEITLNARISAKR